MFSASADLNCSDRKASRALVDQLADYLMWISLPNGLQPNDTNLSLSLSLMQLPPLFLALYLISGWVLFYYPLLHPPLLFFSLPSVSALVVFLVY